MPELPEVETVLQGVKPHIESQIIQDVVIRQDKLRWPIPPYFRNQLIQQKIGTLSRRAKYLLMPVGAGTVILHLGMSGSLRIVDREKSPERHDHVDIIFSDTHLLRYNDPRRFGCVLWTDAAILKHTLFKHLGPEPLTDDFSADYLYQAIKNRSAAIKTLLMNNQVVVGVGNIYVAEALFIAQVHPLIPGKKLSKRTCLRLVRAIQQVLDAAIQEGGTTIKDFSNSEGKPGYFTQALQVYGRAGLPCLQCQQPLQSIKVGQRSTVFCPHCQKKG
ncbi:MAG: bifunctional DNA-formamidopyrimidine glycosylase/DNA-(apurinic or apyrimidinic site) lyase [Legionellaceae bacterium]|nr:bifunctional DNA-formamidopyrimidine glycosylase/DNA-(apurinic or apyrimidinic site) lyase [Legionellaceae bacterium]